MDKNRKRKKKRERHESKRGRSSCENLYLHDILIVKNKIQLTLADMLCVDVFRVSVTLVWLVMLVVDDCGRSDCPCRYICANGLRLRDLFRLERERRADDDHVTAW